MWQGTGLRPPASMIDTARSYLADEDIVGQWLDDCCQLDPGARCQSRRLYSSFKAWAEAHGEAPGSARSLGDALRMRGFEPAKVERHRGWKGLTLRHHATGPESEP
jgi:putative DNA primase/helicase